MKCVCDACGCVFLHDHNYPDSQAVAVNYGKVAPEFEDLPEPDKTKAHEWLAAVARRPNYISNYLFIETGNLASLTFLTHHKWITGKIKYANDTYRLTDAGADALIALNSERGDPALKRRVDD
ncbi:hypothetical protein RMSM_06062 [Rhodopirellula maiorica SM1]|uniref:Uncharacterized protein n=2 Tax=Novipirellula TaxID=2795426 RepID=M5RBZ9_9BACT|nr:hypothetical protein RMSM_06062 [Rhodopirellula maiorica SM1]